MSCPHTSSMHRSDHEHTRGCLKHTWATYIGMHVYTYTYVHAMLQCIRTWSPLYRATHACIGKQQQFQTTCIWHTHTHTLWTLDLWKTIQRYAVIFHSSYDDMHTRIYAVYASADTHAHIRIIRDHVCIQKPLYSRM